MKIGCTAPYANVGDLCDKSDFNGAAGVVNDYVTSADSANRYAFGTPASTPPAPFQLVPLARFC